MKKELFEELLESVKQGSAIMKGTMEPSRIFNFPESEVKKLRENYGLSTQVTKSVYALSSNNAFPADTSTSFNSPSKK